MSVTVVSCVYGKNGFGAFIPRWIEAVDKLDPAPDRVIVASDEMYMVPGDVDILRLRCTWQYPQAYYLAAAIRLVDTDWVWVVDMDDYAMVDGLAGIDEVAADVWQMGMKTSSGEVYVPPQLTADEYLALDHNPFVAGSAFRVDAYRRAGGYRDVAIQDWGLWLALAASNASFQSSGRTHYHYMRHPLTRSETETTIEQRPKHTAEIERALVT